MPVWGTADPATLSGDISEVKFDSTGGRYLVASTIEIPSGKSVLIPAGTVFRFQIGAEFSINGSCTIAGTGNDTVVFTSINDPLYNKSSASASPFDWEGVTVSTGSPEIIMKHLLIKYSRNPLTATCTKIVLDSVYRTQTKTPFFRINGNQYKVRNYEPFIFPVITLPDTTGIVQSPKPGIISLMKRKNTRRVLLGGGAGALLVSGGSAIGYFVTRSRRDEALSHYQDNSIDDFNYRKDEKELAIDLDKRGQNLQLSAVVSGIVGVVLLSGFSITFLF